MIAPEKVVDDDAAALDAALSVLAAAIFDDDLPTPRVVFTFPDADRDQLARIIRALPQAGWQLYSGVVTSFWHGSIGPVSIHLDPLLPKPEPMTTEQALAELLGGVQ